MALDNAARHDHGPSPSGEWTLEGDSATAVLHLRALAPSLSVGAQHFDVTEVDRAREGLPPLFVLSVGGESVGAMDFLGLPAARTLMRVFLCSDLGTQCALPQGDQLAMGFARTWLDRLRRLGFMMDAPQAAAARPALGFRLPGGG